MESGDFARFVREVEAMVRSPLATPELVHAVSQALKRLLDRDFMGANLVRPLATKPYSQYLLHVAPDRSWSVVAFVWPAGSATPVHDHGCWGVVGVYRGEETETVFQLREGDRDRGPAWLSRGAARLAHRGDVTTVMPPEDIHQVSNRGSETAVSIHVYGSDIGAQQRHAFDAESGRVTSFVSGYDQPEATR